MRASLSVDPVVGAGVGRYFADMGVFDERRDMARLERGFQAAVALGVAAAVFTFFLWFRGIAGVGAVGLLLLLTGGILGLGVRVREGSVPAARGLLFLGAVAVLLGVLYRPLTFDLLALVALFFFYRAHGAAVVQARRDEAAQGQESRKKGSPERGTGSRGRRSG